MISEVDEARLMLELRIQLLEIHLRTLGKIIDEIEVKIDKASV